MQTQEAEPAEISVTDNDFQRNFPLQINKSFETEHYMVKIKIDKL